MSRLTLSSTPKTEYTVISNLFIDRYMPRANGMYVKVYLYLLRLLGSARTDSTLAEIADFLDETEKDIERALKYWEGQRLIRIEREGGAPAGVVFLEPPEEEGSRGAEAGAYGGGAGQAGAGNRDFRSAAPGAYGGGAGQASAGNRDFRSVPSGAYGGEAGQAGAENRDFRSAASGAYGGEAEQADEGGLSSRRAPSGPYAAEAGGPEGPDAEAPSGATMAAPPLINASLAFAKRALQGKAHSRFPQTAGGACAPAEFIIVSFTKKINSSIPAGSPSPDLRLRLFPGPHTTNVSVIPKVVRSAPLSQPAHDKRMNES